MTRTSEFRMMAMARLHRRSNVNRGDRMVLEQRPSRSKSSWNRRLKICQQRKQRMALRPNLWHVGLKDMARYVTDYSLFEVVAAFRSIFSKVENACYTVFHFSRAAVIR